MQRRGTRTFVWVLGATVPWLGIGCGDSGTKPPQDMGNCGHVLASGIVLRSAGAVVAAEWKGAVHGTLATTVGGRIEDVQAVFLAADSSAVVLPGEDCSTNRLAWQVEDTAIATVAAGSTKWAFTITGLAPGATTVRLRPMHETHSHYATQPIPIVIQ